MQIFLRMKYNDFLIWQVAAKVAVEPSCVQVRSHDTIFHPICFRQKSYDVNTQAKSKYRVKIGWRSISIECDDNCIKGMVKEIWSDFN